MIIENITVGADPELFIVNEKTGKVVSSIGIIPGEKGNAWRSDDMPEGFGIEVDNILGEFNIPPCRTKEEFINNIEYMKDYIDRFVKEKNPDLGIQCIASREVDEDQLQSDEAKLFGCSPDFNAYTERENEKPDGESTNLRSAGFHIHIGYDNNNIDTSVELVKYLDLYLGVPAVIDDPDKKRRSLYGKAGSFRLTPYGVEYRSLSSALMKDKKTLKKVWYRIISAIDAFNNGKGLPPSNIVRKAIDNSSINKAKEIIEVYNLV
jgi:hypothetical protein ORF005